MSAKLPIATGSWGEKKVTLGNATYVVLFMPRGREYRVEERKGKGEAATTERRDIVWLDLPRQV